MIIGIVALIAIIAIAVGIWGKASPKCPDLQIISSGTTYAIDEPVAFRLKEAPSENIEYKWITGDGQEAYEDSPVFSFSEEGEQTIDLTVSTTNRECEAKSYIIKITAEVTDSIVVEDDTLDIIPGKISVSKNPVCVKEQITFKDNTEGASAYWWDFGDKNNSSHPSPKHRYKKPGKYTISRTLNGDKDLSTMIEVEVEVCKKTSTSGGNGSFSREPTITAAFAASKTVANIKESIHFTNETKGKAYSWYWDFGNGYTSNEKHPSHTYKYPGTYTVTLKVNNKGENTTQKTITIRPPSPPPPPDDDVILPPPPPPPPPPNLKSKFQKVANSSDDELKLNIYYEDLLPLVAGEKIPVKVVKGGVEINSGNTFYKYFNSLNIEGGQTISRVEILSKDENGKITSLKITEQ